MTVSGKLEQMQKKKSFWPLLNGNDGRSTWQLLSEPHTAGRKGNMSEKTWSFSFGMPISEPASSSSTFGLDVLERGEQLVVKAEVPGIPEDSMNLEMSKDSFKLTATLPCPERKEKDVHLWHASRPCGTRTQTIHLPFDVDPDQVEASLDEGVLTVTAPKVAGTERNTISTRASFHSR